MAQVQQSHPSRSKTNKTQCCGFTAEHRRCRLERDTYSKSLFCKIHRKYPETFMDLFQKAQSHYPVWFTKRECAELDYILKHRIIPLNENRISQKITPAFMNYLLQNVCVSESWVIARCVQYLTEKPYILPKDLDILLSYEHTIIKRLILIKLIIEDIGNTFFHSTPLNLKDSFALLFKHPYFRETFLEKSVPLRQFIQIEKEEIFHHLWHYYSTTDEDKEFWEEHISENLELLELPLTEQHAKTFHQSQISPFKEDLCFRRR